MSDERMKSIHRCLKAVAIATTVGWVATAVADDAADAVLSRLRTELPKVQWQPQELKHLDLRGVERRDTAVVGYEGDEGVLAVVLDESSTSKGRLLLQRFAIHPGKQLGVCAKPVRIEVLKFSCERDEGSIKGCKPNPRASEIAIAGGDCDALFVFWNPSLKALDWWRL